jgi:polyvinyl alcohol dehydrogenase (cytochrome)
MRIGRGAITLSCLTLWAACDGGSNHQASPAGTGGSGGDVGGVAGAASGGSAATGAAGADAGVSVDAPPVTSGPDGAPGDSGSPLDGGSGGEPPDAAPPPLGSLDWPMFGRDYSNSRASTDVSIGAQQLANLRVAQRVTGAGVTSTPALVGGVVYYSDYAGWLRAIDAGTGASVWSAHLQSGMLTPSPFVASDTVYIAGDASNIYAVNRMTGAVRWSTKIETTPSNRIWSSPIVVGDTLVIGAGSYQVFIPATPTFRGSIVGLGASDGKEKWRVAVCPDPDCGGGVSVWSSVAVDPALKLAYIGTGQAYYAPAGPYSDSIIAVDYETGAMAWHYQITANDIYNINSGDATHDRDVGTSPNLFEASIGGTARKLVGVGDKGGHYTVLDRETGALIWQTRTDPRTPPGSPIGGVMGAPAVANGRIFLTNNTSTMGTGRFDARPGTCTAFALDAATGAVLWMTPLPAGSFSGNSVANGLLYFVTYDGQLRVLDTKDGKLLASIAIGAAVGGYVGDPTDGFPDGSTSGPVVANGRIYAGYGWTWGATITGGLAILDLGGN